MGSASALLTMKTHRICCMKRESGDDVGNDLVFQLLKAILQGQLFLLHALDLERVAARCHHRIYGRVEIRMFLLEAGKFQPDIGLILIRMIHDTKSSARC